MSFELLSNLPRKDKPSVCEFSFLVLPKKIFGGALGGFFGWTYRQTFVKFLDQDISIAFVSSKLL